MKISVKGKNEVLSKKQIKYIVRLFGKLTLSPQLYPNINLLIQNMNLSNNTWGYCGIADIEEKKPRTFEILLNPHISKPKQIRTLAHEMVHLKQLALGQFMPYDNNEYKWNNNIVTMTSEEYNDMPWETEAKSQEDYLIREYKKQVKLDGMQF